MTDSNSATELREHYLSQLDEALGGLPHRLAVELRAGITEELNGLDGEALTQRIAELGAPADVANAARDEGLSVRPESASPAAPAVTTVPAPLPAPSVPIGESKGYAITAAIILGVGGIVIPIVGWIIGAVLVATSKLWTAKERVWAIIMPAVTLAVALGVGTLWNLTARGLTDDGEGPEFGPPVGADISPLVPAPFDIWWSSLFLVGFIIAPLSALWLILRLRGRSSGAVPPR